MPSGRKRWCHSGLQVAAAAKGAGKQVQEPGWPAAQGRSLGRHCFNASLALQERQIAAAGHAAALACPMSLELVNVGLTTSRVCPGSSTRPPKSPAQSRAKGAKFRLPTCSPRGPGSGLAGRALDGSRQ